MFLGILGVDKRFHPIDPIWTDVTFVAKMILIHSASLKCPSIIIESPAFVAKSLNYLKD